MNGKSTNRTQLALGHVPVQRRWYTAKIKKQVLEDGTERAGLKPFMTELPGVDVLETQAKR